MALVPRGYGGFPPVQFGPPHQHNNRYYNGGYGRRDAVFAPGYPAQPFYQPPFNPAGEYPLAGYNQVKRPGLGAQFVTFVNQLDERYRSEQYARKLDKMQKNAWKQQVNNMPLPMYTAPQAPFPTDYDAGVVYQYEKETRYIPYPVYVGPGAAGYGGSGNLGYGAGGNLGYADPSNIGYTAGSSINFGTGGLSLPPKIRVIFIPTGNSSFEQPYIGPLAMPPFLYNRMSQPLCSFPLPPPLPQLGSLPLTPAIQQMVMQRYSNPVAVLPFSSNWLMPQQMMSGYPQAQQQQQQYQQPMLPMSGFQSLPPAPPSYMPPPPMPNFQSFPPTSQPYIPPPMPAFESFPPASQPYLSPPMPAFQSLPPAPQSYIHPPPTIPTNLTVLPAPPLQTPFSDANTFSSVPQYPNSGYPSLCRACPPAPPPLNILVTGHCWVQHCAACHHVPIPVSNPNARPSGGRITPLLRYPTVPQYVPDQTIQQQQYHHANAPVMMRPWLRKTPPLPPGAVVISDEYISRRDTYPRHHHSQRQHRQHQRRSDPTKRSTTLSTTATPSSKRGNRSVSPKINNNSNNNAIQHKESVKSKSVTSKSSSGTLSNDSSVEYQKLTLNPSKPQQNKIPQQLAGEARNINLQYNYQAQEIPSVYLLNGYMKSSSEASSLFSNLEKSSSDISPLSIKEHNQNSLPSIDLNSIKEESTSDKESQKSIPSFSRITKPKEKLIIIREFMTNSPSTISTVSSNMTFSIITKDSDSISTTSTIKAAKFEEDDILTRDIF